MGKLRNTHDQGALFGWHGVNMWTEPTLADSVTRDQYYVFTGPDGWAWVEMFYEGRHVTAPSPRRDIGEHLACLQATYPTATVDELVTAEDVADAMLCVRA